MLISRDFDELRLRQRRGDADERLVGKAHGAFGDRVHVAGEAEGGEIVEQVLAEAAAVFEPRKFLVGEAQVFQIIERVLEAGGEQEAATIRQPPHEELEHGLLVLALVQVGLDHVELVEVGGEGAGEGDHGP